MFTCATPVRQTAKHLVSRSNAAQGDVVGLKGDVARALRELGEASAREGSAVAALAELERVKARMEAACSTLKARPLLELQCPGSHGRPARAWTPPAPCISAAALHGLDVRFGGQVLSVKACFRCEFLAHEKREWPALARAPHNVRMLEGMHADVQEPLVLLPAWRPCMPSGLW